MMTLEDVNHIEGHTQVTLQSKGIWSDAETITAINRAIFGSDTLPAHTSGLVKQAISISTSKLYAPYHALGNR